MEVNIRDPIHGFIMLNNLEGELIQLYPFQRLRFIQSSTLPNLPVQQVSISLNYTFRQDVPFSPGGFHHGVHGSLSL